MRPDNGKEYIQDMDLRNASDGEYMHHLYRKIGYAGGDDAVQTEYAIKQYEGGDNDDGGEGMVVGGDTEIDNLTFNGTDAQKVSLTYSKLTPEELMLAVTPAGPSLKEATDIEIEVEYCRATIDSSKTEALRGIARLQQAYNRFGIQPAHPAVYSLGDDVPRDFWIYVFTHGYGTLNISFDDFLQIEGNVQQKKFVVVYDENDFSDGFSFDFRRKTDTAGDATDQFGLNYPHTYSGKVGSKSVHAYFLQKADLHKYGIVVLDSRSNSTLTFFGAVGAALAGAEKNVWAEITVLKPREASGVQPKYAVKQFKG
eukprot:GHVS01026792.1.p1 GENE.GHVS01026792.1~~GHVS01026792.1.p1  ORF type:complete len:346 (-),score=36.78 GHVS01026792.1:215-1150(-)